MQLTRDELRAAYSQMCLIRNFEDTVHEEFSAGNIPGFVHLSPVKRPRVLVYACTWAITMSSPRPTAGTGTASPRAAIRAP